MGKMTEDMAADAVAQMQTEEVSKNAPGAPDTEEVAGTPNTSDLEFEVRKLREEKQELEAYRERARRMVTHDGSWDDEYEQAARHLMSDAGYEPDAIDSWIKYQQAQTTGAPEVPQDETMTRPNTNSAPPQKDVDGDPRDEMIQKLQQRLDALETQSGDTRLQVLQRQLEETLDSTFRSHDPVVGLLEKIKRLAGDDDMSNRTSILREDIKKATLENIKRKTAAGGQFDPSWFEREAKAAADEVVNKLRAVIGDPDRLMRAPETVTGQDEIRRGVPVQDPKWESGDSPAVAQGKTREFSTDKLLEGIELLNKGGASRA